MTSPTNSTLIHPSAILLLVMIVSGCQSGLKLQDAIPSAKVKERSGLQALQRYDQTVRSYTKDAQGKLTEVAGLSCVLQSQDLSAKVVTPQRVSLPAFAAGARFQDGGRPSNLQVRCHGNGMSGSAVIKAQSSFRPRSSSDQYSTTNRLDLGLSSTAPWVYPPIKVTVK
ncbi:hypothetical protein [Aliiroseovarius sp. 2305UL8-7]|uniref:hypothetical protein n=1 Tax=Aliiroseovarius conchicola TaxID=3121637 RepID=UPI0035299929